MGGVVPPVAVAIGSNLGDRHAHLTYGVTRLRSVLADLRLSTIIETDAVDVVGVQPPFLNAAVTGRYDGAARSLLDELLRIEQERGRERPYARAPRTLDLDLILFGDERVEEEQIGRLRAVKRKRDSRAAGRDLDELKHACRTGANVMPFCIAAVKDHVTVQATVVIVPSVASLRIRLLN